jgi:hypothetical protein
MMESCDGELGVLPLRHAASMDSGGFLSSMRAYSALHWWIYVVYEEYYALHWGVLAHEKSTSINE